MTFKDIIFYSVFITGIITSSVVKSDSNWATAGADLNNSRNQSNEIAINPASVSNLVKKWEVTTQGDVTANPAVDEGYIYFPDSAGYLYKVDKFNGNIEWSIPISSYTNIPNDFARATPAIVGDSLILGNQSGKLPSPEPAQVFAVDKNNGALLWATQVDDTIYSFITHSAIVHNGTAYVGLASNEELIAGFWPAAYGFKFHFRGSVVALDVNTGAIKWKTYTVPEGYSGAAVWGSTGAVDIKRNQIYMATGNNYSVPLSVQDCMKNGGKPSKCIDQKDYFDSIVAFNLDTGQIEWGSRGLTYDAWNVGCGLDIPGVFKVAPNDNCPDPKGPDWDFAQGPILFNKHGLVGAGQKSGKYWAFNADDGNLAWVTQVSPGGLTGGLQWGSAFDGRRIYVANANSGLKGAAPLNDSEIWNLQDGTTTNAGGWSALNPKNGKIIWEKVDPDGGRAEAAVTSANGVVFGCNLKYSKGTMRALNAQTGAELWSYDSGGACNAGPSVSDGMVFWGSGTFLGNPDAPRKVFAFGLP